METMTKTQSKPTSYDLRKDKRELEAEIEKLLHEHDGEITEEIDDLLTQLTDVNDDIISKISSLQWAKKKVEAEIASIKAKEGYWKQVADAEKKSRTARENNLQRVKDLAVLNLRSLEEQFVRIDGKKVYLRDICKVTITDEEAAFTHLSEHDLASCRTILEEKESKELADALHQIRSEIQTEDGEPMLLSGESNTAIGRAIQIMEQASRQIVLAGGKEVNAHGKEMNDTYLRESEKARSRLADINAVFDSPDMMETGRAQEMEKERADILTWLDRMQQDYSIPGAEIEIKKAVFGL